MELSPSLYCRFPDSDDFYDAYVSPLDGRNSYYNNQTLIRSSSAAAAGDFNFEIEREIFPDIPRSGYVICTRWNIRVAGKFDSRFKKRVRSHLRHCHVPTTMRDCLDSVLDVVLQKPPKLPRVTVRLQALMDYCRKTEDLVCELEMEREMEDPVTNSMPTPLMMPAIHKDIMEDLEIDDDEDDDERETKAKKLRCSHVFHGGKSLEKIDTCQLSRNGVMPPSTSRTT